MAAGLTVTRTQQPGSPVGLTPEAIGKDVVALWYPAGASLLGNQGGVLNQGAATRRRDTLQVRTATTASSLPGLNMMTGASRISALVVMTPRTLGNRFGLVSIQGTGSSGSQHAFSLCSGYSTNTKIFLYIGLQFATELGTNVFQSGVRAIYGVTYDNNASVRSTFYKNGLKIGTDNMSGGGVLADCSTGVYPGGVIGNVTDTFVGDGDFELIAIKNGVWTEAEMMSLGNNPWQLLAPITLSPLFGVTAAGGTSHAYWIGHQANMTVGAGVA